MMSRSPQICSCAKAGDVKARATQHIESLYAYGDSEVMFKPTLAAQDQFREKFGEAIRLRTRAALTGAAHQTRMRVRVWRLKPAPAG
jgi:hypothetical protein